MNPSEFLLHLFGIVATGAAIYGGIRSDLRHLSEGVKRAHERIDSILTRS